MQLDLAGRVVVVTGGTKGIGRATVLALAAAGVQVVFQGRDAADAAAIIESASASGPAPVFVPGDLFEYETARVLLSTALDGFGRVDGAVGSGGGSRIGLKLFREMEAGDFEEYYRAVTIPRLHLAHAASLAMAERGYGKIVLVTTDAGRIPTPAETVVGAAAASVVFLVRTLGRELARDGVRINAVALTLTRGTPAYDRYLAGRAAGAEGVSGRAVNVKAFSKLEDRVPFGLGDAEEAAVLIGYLLAPESDGITGATLSVNRGAYFPSYA